MAVMKLYEVGMRTAPGRYRDRKGEVARHSATRNSAAEFHFAASGISIIRNQHAGAAVLHAAKFQSLPYSKQQQIPNNESSSLSTIQLAGFNSIAVRLSREAQDSEYSTIHTKTG